MISEWEDRIESIIFVLAVGAALFAGIVRFSALCGEHQRVSTNLEQAKAQDYTRADFFSLCVDAGFLPALPSTSPASDAEFVLALLEMQEEGTCVTIPPPYPSIVKDSFDTNVPRHVNIARIVEALVKVEKAGLWKRTALTDPNVPEGQRWTILRDSHTPALRSTGFTAAQIDSFFDPNVHDQSKWKILHDWRVRELEKAKANLPSRRDGALLSACIAFCVVIVAGHGIFMLVRRV